MLDRIFEEAPRLFTLYTAVFLAEAIGRTIAMTLWGCFIGFICGFLIALLQTTRGRLLLPLRLLIILYVETFRRIPFLVILYLILFAAQGLSDQMSLFVIAVISICLLSTAFFSQIIRAGFDSVPRQQLEAAEAMNFGLMRTLFLVILPQSWKVILPPAFAFMVMFIKDTSLASQMGVVELTFAGKVLMNRGFSPVLIYGVVLLGYFILSYPLTRLGAHLEERLGSPRIRKSL